MNTLTHAIPTLSRWRLAEWTARAWRRMGWRHVVLGLALQALLGVFGPLGGSFLLPVDGPGTDFIANLLNGSKVFGGVSIVYCVLVADEAFDDGVPPLRAYGLAVIALAAIVPVGDWFLAGLMGWDRDPSPQMAFWTQAMLFQGGLWMSIYAYWRVTQRAMRRAQAAETDRVRDEQRVQTARLLALQSRVEPQMLFDSLGRIGALHALQPEAADALLADLIALLRAMLPGAKADNSTVEREFALVEAWLRVTRKAAHGADRVDLRMTPDAGPIGIAPMLVLPLLRAVLALPCATQPEWVLSAKTASDRLIVTLQSTVRADAEADGLLERADLSSLDDRLAQLFGRSGRLTASSRPPTLTLDLPRLQGDPDDDRADR
jgi:Histidine kinase